MLESMKVREISLLDAQCKMNAKIFGDPECLLVAAECEDGRPNADCQMPFFLIFFFFSVQDQILVQDQTEF